MSDLQKLEDRQQLQEKAIAALQEHTKKVNLALFGDDNGNKGITRQVDEMYKFFTGYSFTGKFLKNALVVLGTIAAIVAAIVEIIRRTR